MKRFQKTFGKGCYKEVYVLKVKNDGTYAMELTDYCGNEVNNYYYASDSFNLVGQWAYEMANNSDVGCKVNEWMCEKIGLKFFND